MIVRCLVILLCAVSTLLADATTQPAEMSDAATTQPTTQPAAERRKLPSAAELAARIREQRQTHRPIPHVAQINLNAAIVERPADFIWFAREDTDTLQSLLTRIELATSDQALDAILVTLRSTSLNLAQAQEMRAALARAKAAGKRVFVYADSYDTITYTVACGASDVCLLDGGEILIPGIGIETMFARGLLDKIGVQADYVQIGEYKGADEQFTRTEPSPELREELNKLADALYAQIIDGIAHHRALPRERVAELVDEALISAKRARETGLVDHLIDIDGMEELIARAFEQQEVHLAEDYGLPEREQLDFTNIFSLLARLAREPKQSEQPVIAIVYAEGMIIDGEGGETIFGSRFIGSDDIREAMRTIREDDNIKGVVLRIDSPGGSALASEAMWQAVRRASGEKPLVVSIGSMAASGGYYLASASDHIIADPTAIVGSIGVVGGKFVLKDLYDKIGVSTESFVRGHNADLFSSSQPFSERQRNLVRTWMSNTYEQFTSRVLETRKGRIEDIDRVARGRVFLAQQARELGMVDQLGGLMDAVVYIAERTGLKGGEYEIRAVPGPTTLADLLSGRAGGAMSPVPARLTLTEQSILPALSPATRQMLGWQVQSLQLLQQRPVILVSPYVIRVR